MVLRWFTGLRERLKALFARGRFESDLDEELRFHLDEARKRNIRRGMSPAEAERAARRDFGQVERIKDEVRSETGVGLVQDLILDLKYALRNLRRRPGFSFVVIFTIAICIGANGAVFSVVHSVLIRPLPFPDSDRLVRIFNSYPNAGNPRAGNSVPDFHDRRELVNSLEDVALFDADGTFLGGDLGGRHAFSMLVTPSFFSVLRVTPALGRGFEDEFVGSDGIRETIIGHKLWKSAFGSSPDVIGTTTILHEVPHTIVGVLPESFRFSTWDAQVFIPLVFSPVERSDEARGDARRELPGTGHSDRYQMVGRLAAGSTVEVAQAEIDALNRARVAEYPADLRNVVTEAGFHTVVRPYLADMTRAVRRPFMLLWAGVLIVLMIGAANVTSLLHIRARSRSREIAARTALGAGRSRILRQFMTESTVMALVGGGLGLLLAQWSLEFLSAFEVYEIPRVDDVSVSGVVIVSTVSAAIVLGAVAGAAPTLAILSNKGISLFQGRRGGTGRGTSRMHRGLVSSQIALAFVLVSNAGLLLASLSNLIAVDRGFDSNQVVVAGMSLPDSRYPDGWARLEFVRQLLASVGSVPGVRSVAVASQLPFSGGAWRTAYVAEGVDRAQAEAVGLPYVTVVSARFFQTLGIDFVSGDGFRASDDGTGQRVVVIDEALARKYWPHSDPVGQSIWKGTEPGARDIRTIVGVVESIKQVSLMEADPVGAIYVPLSENPLGSFRIAVKFEGDRTSVWPVVRTRIKALDPSLPVFATETIEESVAESLILQRTPMQLLAAFAFIGLFLGALGVYGVMAYAVGSRKKEIGIRLAIGSTRRQIASLVGREWMTVVGIGVALGILGTLASSRIIAGLLYGTGPLDPRVLVSALGIILGAALLSCFLPVRRAIQVDPVKSLRAD